MAMTLQELLAQCKGGIGMTERNVPKVMSGAKTQTRRIIKIKRSSDCPDEIPDDLLSSEILEWRQQDGQWFGLNEYRTIALAGRVHQIGDRLYVKEALKKAECPPDYPFARYKADSMPVQTRGIARPWKRDDGTPWKQNVIPARYMPKSAARTVIEITDVKCERIKDIALEDVQAEGIQSLLGKQSIDPTMLARFIDLWNDTNGNDAWERNDWTFAYTFKILEPS